MSSQSSSKHFIPPASEDEPAPKKARSAGRPLPSSPLAFTDDMPLPYGARERVSSINSPRPHGSAIPLSTFHRVKIESEGVEECLKHPKEIASKLKFCLGLRRDFIWTPPVERKPWANKHAPKYKAPTPKHSYKQTEHTFAMVDGVISVWKNKAEREAAAKPQHAVVSRKAYEKALRDLMKVILDGECRTFCHGRLTTLEARFKLHRMLNHNLESQQQKTCPHRDFYNVRKVDNHVHHSACMNQKHLLRFIKHKLKLNGKQKVIKRDGKMLTLKQVFESLDMTAYDLSVDMLDMHAGKTFHRFDKFNLKYNPLGESRLREIFLKTQNLINGKYLAEVTQEVMDDLEQNKYQSAEYRVSIYGKNKDEWSKLAAWIVDNNLFHANVRWMIQIPRLFHAYRKANLLENFEQMIDNIFHALFQVTVDPSVDPKLHLFLQQMVGFDSVDDESQREDPRVHAAGLKLPADWTGTHNPSYSMFSYYLYANIQTLNKLRFSKGLSTFTYRPHSGEAGDFEHLAVSFLTADSINHGIVLQQSTVLQYLYYLAQIGISVSPLSNNLLFIEYDKNPFPRFFNRGLNVTLSTDDPLMIHVTKEPLVEEYSVAAQVWKLTPVDMCEMARNSVLQSGFEHRYKAAWIGNDYFLRSTKGNDLDKTNVPPIRIEVRLELLKEEYATLQRFGGFESFGLEFCDRL